MNWRPKDWENPYREFGMNIELLRDNHISFRVLSEKEAIEADKYEAFEAGADAVLEALYKLAQQSPTRTFTIDSRVVTIYEVK